MSNFKPLAIHGSYLVRKALEVSAFEGREAAHRWLNDTFPEMSESERNAILDLEAILEGDSNNGFRLVWKD